MNNTPKVLLTICLEGAALVRQNEVKKYPYAKVHSLPNGKEKVLERGTYEHKDLVAKDVYKTQTINEEAYNFFRSDDSKPTQQCFKKYRQEWGKMNPKQRLEAHLHILCLCSRGKSFTYEILDK